MNRPRGRGDVLSGFLYFYFGCDAFLLHIGVCLNDCGCKTTTCDKPPCLDA